MNPNNAVCQAAQWRFDPLRGDFVRLTGYGLITTDQARAIGRVESEFERMLQDAHKRAMLLPFEERGPYRDRVYAEQMAIRKQAIQQALGENHE